MADDYFSVMQRVEQRLHDREQVVKVQGSQLDTTELELEELYKRWQLFVKWISPYAPPPIKPRGRLNCKTIRFARLHEISYSTKNRLSTKGNYSGLLLFSDFHHHLPRFMVIHRSPRCTAKIIASTKAIPHKTQDAA